MTAGRGGATATGGSGAGGTGVPITSAAFPLKLSSDLRYLVDQNNQPFLIHGEAAWSLIVQLNDADAERYLEDRRTRGVNLVMVNLIEHKFTTSPPKNAAGQAPFTVAGDFSTPNEAYFAHADSVIARAASKGIAVLLAPAYLGYDGGAEGWYQEIVANGATKMTNWGRYLGARYRTFDNVVWLDGGDYAPPSSGLALVNAIVSGIKEMDTRHLHVPHWGVEVSGADVATSWLDVDTTYTYKPTHLKSLADYNRDQSGTRTRAHFLIESIYENEHSSTRRQLRAQAYGALLTGACGQIFGNLPIWSFASGWQSALGSAGSVSMMHVRELFAPRPWQTLIPDQANTTLTAGQGTSSTADYAMLARSADGRLAIAYVPTVRSVTIALSMMAGPVRARWFDPSNGAFTDVSGSPLPNSGTRALSPPANNAAGDSDWVLLLDVP